MSERLYSFPPMHEESFENGLQVTWIPDHEQETINIALQFPFGRFADPTGLEGLSGLMLSLIQKGTEQTPFEQFSQRLEFTGSSIFAEAGEEHSIIGCRMLARHASEIIPLFREMIFKPAFAKGEFTKIKREYITSLNAEATEPSGIASRHFHALLFGRKHPAGASGTIASATKITLAHIKSHFRTHIHPAGAFLIFGGAFNHDQFSAQWRNTFTAWPRGTAAGTAVVTANADWPKPAIRLIDKQDITQTTITAGHLLPGEKSAQRDEIAIANYILGGGHFSSRLMTEVRSRMGKAYSISSQVASAREFGHFTINTSTQNAQVAIMLKSIHDVYRQFATLGITQDELDRARQFALGNMAFQLEGIGNVVEKLLWLRFHGRNLDYIELFSERMERLTLTRVNTAIREHFKPESLIICAVGKAKEIRTQLEESGAVEQVHFRKKL